MGKGAHNRGTARGTANEEKVKRGSKDLVSLGFSFILLLLCDLNALTGYTKKGRGRGGRSKTACLYITIQGSHICPC